ncbi:hypothetical protein TrRE_jg5932 [Triparma retinervis]|uniref:Glycoside hydrolase family 5 domain-containing protein n=1 Tax=Triparma retinervis TaxID=2557542 RepID=A0A9W7EDG3_9STRA|nr:hypothetical protein TrRE_jg5932 [Triparma retinervis]
MSFFFFFSIILAILCKLHLAETASIVESADRLPLLTEGRRLVDQDGHHVKLACVNWYGAHMELFSVHGLHKRGLSEIVDDIVEAGFNCVRMPYSLDLTFKSTHVVPDFALEANPDLKGKTGLEIFHLTMKALTDAKLMVFLNNHNSIAAWCCNADSEDGIWSNDAYDAEQWMESLVFLAEYYKNDKYVIGMDLRNEIHDVKSKQRFITWGESEDIDNDWKYATEVASKRIYEVNQDWLIIVSGLCFSFDLRSMVGNLPSIPQERKLVWTTHYYSFSRWWIRLGDRLSDSLDWEGGSKEAWEKVADYCGKWTVVIGVAIGAVVLALVARRSVGLGGGIVIVPERRMVKFSVWGMTLFLWCTFIAVGLGVGGDSIREGYDKAGCAVMAIEADMMDADSLNGKGGEKGGGGQGKDCKEWIVHFCLVNFFLVGVVGLVALSQVKSIALKTPTYQMLHDELKSKWGGLEGSAPVLVGEFGSGTDGKGANNDWWHQMMRFLDEYDLDYAYWPWNGEKWNEEAYEYQNEGYGLVTVEWDGIRYPEKLADLMRLG